ncbi:MAG: T9SS type A sorting domain-containing protein [Flavobacteriales bacterium]
MKKFLLLCFIFSSCLSFSQDWQPFPLGQKSYFIHGNIYGRYTPGDSLINEFMVDSLRNYGSSQTAYFNFKTPNIDTCYHNIITTNGPANFFYFSIHDNERPDSITIENNVYTFYFYDYSLQPENTFIFKPLTQKDSSWIFSYPSSGFNELKITCDSVYFDTIIGSIIDSVKLFSVKALNNGTPIINSINQNKYILSKNYGFKVFNNYPLLGLKNTSQQIGFVAPVFDDYFHLNIGDVLIWKDEFRVPPWPGNPPSYTIYYKDSLENISNTSDTLIYSFIRTFNNQTVSTGGYQRIKSNDNTGFSVGTSTLAPKNMNNPYLDEVSPYLIDSGVIHKDRVNELKYLDNNCIPVAQMDYFYWESFNTKYGLYSYGNNYMDESHSWNIIGSTINGIQEGVAWSTLVTGVNDIEITDNIKIYPNPSKSGNFTVESEKVINLTIVSIEGKTLYNQNINKSKTEVKTYLPKGLYFVQMVLENNKKIVQKLIITD